MMKKAVMVTALSGLLISSSALGQGLKVGVGEDIGPSIVMQFNDTINLSISDDGVAFDYLIHKAGLSAPISVYAGIGAWTGLNDKDDEFGIRFPLGLEAQLLSNLDVFVQFHPELNYKDNDSQGQSSNSDDDDIELDFGTAFGIRFVF